MKPESKRNRSNTNKSESNSDDNTTTGSGSCYDLTELSKALGHDEKKDNKSCFDLSDMSEALDVAEKNETRRQETLRGIEKVQEARMRQIRLRRLEYLIWELFGFNEMLKESSCATERGRRRVPKFRAGGSASRVFIMNRDS